MRIPMPVIARLGLALYLGVLTMLSACANNGDDHDATIRLVSQYAAYPVQDHFEHLSGDIALFPSDVPSINTRDEWVASALQARESGLGSLPRDDQASLLIGSAKAFLLVVHDLTFEARIASTSVTIYERYEVFEDGDVRTLPVERVVEAGKVSARWPVRPFSLSGTSGYQWSAILADSLNPAHIVTGTLDNGE